jgi:deazaflavin-dependent oxidoreductase (nitroreductase family)
MMTRRAVPRVVPLFNHLAKPLVAAGVPMGPNGLLTVRGRTSGEPRSTPLAIIEVDGRRWVWSPWGDVHWVRNLRAAGEATITVRRQAQEVRAVELDPAERVAFFRDTFAPMARAIPFGARFVRLFDGVDIGDPVRAAQDRAVFELHPIAGRSIHA